MANHGFISSKKNLIKEQVEQDLNDICKNRFNGLLSVIPSKWGENGSWFVHTKQNPHDRGFNIWIRSKKKLEHRHGDSWVMYLETVFSNELAIKYNGKLSDEGCGSETWAPIQNKYSSYRDYIIKDLALLEEPKRTEILNFYMSLAPKSFANL